MDVKVEIDGRVKDFARTFKIKDKRILAIMKLCAIEGYDVADSRLKSADSDRRIVDREFDRLWDAVNV